MNASLFDTVPSPNPYIQAGNQSLAAETEGVEYPVGDLSANASSTYVRFAKDVPVIQAPGGGGTIQIFDSRNFPISTTIASSIVTIKPGGLRELHWHPTAEEWVYFAQGQARATVFMGSGAARTFDFFAGDTAVFPDNSGKELFEVHTCALADFQQDIMSRIPPRQKTSSGSRSLKQIALRTYL